MRLVKAMVFAATMELVASHPGLPSLKSDVLNAMPCYGKSVQFLDNVSTRSYETNGELWPYTASSRKFAKEFPASFIPKYDERAVSDARLVGTMQDKMVRKM